MSLKVFISIVFLFTAAVVSSNANAEDSITEARAQAEYDSAVSKLGTDLQTTEVSRKDLELQISQMENQIQSRGPAIENEIKQLQTDDESYRVTNGFFGKKAVMKKDIENKIDSLQKEREGIYADITAAQKKLLIANQEYDKAKRKYDAEKRPLDTDLKATKSVINGLNKEVEALGAMGKLDQLGNRAVHINDKLNAIQSVFDKTLLGVYVQDKLAQFMNSQVACDMVNKCAANSKNRIPASKLRLEIFKDAPERSSRVSPGSPSGAAQ